METKQILEKVVKALDSKKAEDIVALNIHDLTVVADYFVIASGNSVTHIKALIDEVELKLTEAGAPPTNIEGYYQGNWVVLDFDSVIVHVFYKETREFYKLERLWAAAKPVDISELLKAEA